MKDCIIETENLTKKYGNQSSVSNLNIHVRQGRIYGLLGRNGAGKTTTMKMLLGLTTPTSGKIKIFGKNIRENEKEILPRIGSLIESPGFYPNLTATENLKIFADLRGLKDSKYIKGALELVNLPYRDKKLFSQYSLGMKQRLAIALAIIIQNLTALENVEIAAQLCPHPLDAAEVLREVGLGERMKNFPAQLSGGEQQRVAIARALAKNPKLLLCDEPTGALDYVTGKNILKLLQDTCRRTGMTVVIITHNSALTAMADRVISIKSGTIQSVRKNEHVTPVEEIEW